MKNQVRSRLLAVLMIIIMTFTMIPQLVSNEVHADAGDAAIIPVVGGIAPNIIGGRGGSTEGGIWFGNYPQNSNGNGGYNTDPIKWRVLANNHAPVGELLLLSDKNLEGKQFMEDYSINFVSWEESTIRSWLNGYGSASNIKKKDFSSENFKNAAFDAGEYEAVAKTNIVSENNPIYGTNGGENTEDKVFLLSIGDVKRVDYGFHDKYSESDTRKAVNTDYARSRFGSDQNVYWWLRTPGSAPYFATCVSFTGSINNSGEWFYNTFPVRPALNLDLKSAVFTSAAVGGKVSGAVAMDALKEVGNNSTDEWKVTVKDSAHSRFVSSNRADYCIENVLNVEYSGAAKGNNEFISAIITDKEITKPDAKIKYYGRVSNVNTDGDISGTVKIDMNGKLDIDKDYLYLFNEQYNGDKMTDCSSPLILITDFEQFSSPTGHEMKEIPEKISCTEPGNSKYWTCPLCDKYFSDADAENEIPKDSLITRPIGHKYGSWTKLNTTQHQRVCQHDNSHVLKENHKWDAGKVIKKATEKAAGIKTHTCTVCKATMNETIPKPTPKPVSKVSGASAARITAGKTSQTIGWNKVKGADGYDIFFARCNHKGKKHSARMLRTSKATTSSHGRSPGSKEARLTSLTSKPTC